jgi:hypothetical protein
MGWDGILERLSPIFQEPFLMLSNVNIIPVWLILLPQ